VIAYHASRDLIPLYGVYALLFADHGLSAGRISSLFVLWSVTSFLAEVPSGAWADIVDRRRLLALGAVVEGAGFASWTLFPSYPGFALGFVLWGVSGALTSGTFEALVYDDLAARGLAGGYPRLIGRARSAQLLAVLAAEIVAVPLMHLGGYALVGVASVAVTVVQLLLAATMPVTPVARRGGADHETTGGYLRMLRAGLGEAATGPAVRRVLVAAALLAGLTAYDEYFPLVAREHGVPAATVPLLVALTVVGEAVGAALAGRSAGMPGRRIGAVAVAGTVLVSVGALAPAYVDLATIAVGYGLLANAMITAEVRLQQAIAGPARATVTSVLGLGQEVVALAIYGAIGAGTAAGVSVGATIALLGVPVVGVAVLGSRRPTITAQPEARL
jgi:MFS family permease